MEKEGIMREKINLMRERTRKIKPRQEKQGKTEGKEALLGF